jgi:nicotinamidase-related amidase
VRSCAEHFGRQEGIRGLVLKGRDLGSDPATALLVIDLQQALCDAAPPVAVKLVTERIVELLEWAERHSRPVVFVQHWTEPGTILDRGSAGWQLGEALRSRLPAFHLEKNVLSCFSDGKLHAWLQAHGIRRLCVTGMQTEYCITAACEGAAELGYEVILPTDAHMTLDGADKSAAQIVAEANDRLAAIAQCVSAESIVAS